MEFLGHLCRSAAAEELPFLIIGGYAVLAHGHERATFDLDILIPAEAGPRWKEWLAHRGYRLFHEVSAFAQFTATQPGMPPLDLMIVNAETFEKLRATQVEKRVAGITMPLPQVENLIAMKLHASRSRPEHRGGQDWNDVIELIIATGLDVRRPSFRDMVERYGSTDAYERLLARFPEV